MMNTEEDNDILTDEKKNQAVNACVDIYMNIHVSQVKYQPQSVQSTWNIGKQFYTLKFIDSTIQKHE